MKVQKQITHFTTIDIDITEITLLSIEEYEAAKDNIPLLDERWWLRSPGGNGGNAACVDPDGFGDGNYGLNVITAYVGVRPAIRINPRSVDLQIREKVRLEGFTWTYISEGLLLCDSIISHKPFRNTWRTKNANDYKTSYVKKFVESWFAAAKITAQP